MVGILLYHLHFVKLLMFDYDYYPNSKRKPIPKRRNTPIAPPRRPSVLSCHNWWACYPCQQVYHEWTVYVWLSHGHFGSSSPCDKGRIHIEFEAKRLGKVDDHPELNIGIAKQVDFFLRNSSHCCSGFSVACMSWNRSSAGCLVAVNGAAAEVWWTSRLCQLAMPRLTSNQTLRFLTQQMSSIRRSNGGPQQKLKWLRAQ